MDAQVFLIPGSDAPNLSMPPQHEAHVTVPFDALPAYFEGHIALPGTPPPSKWDTMQIVREFYGNIDLDIPPQECLQKSFEKKLDDMIGKRLDHEGQPMLLLYIQSMNGEEPQPIFLTDFTKPIAMNSIPVSEHPGEWETAFEANLPAMRAGRGIAELPQRRNVFCVGAGPSLRRNAKRLEEIDHNDSAIVGLNEVLGILPASLVDYYLCLDKNSPEAWWKDRDCSKTVLLAGPYANHAILDHNWKDVLWVLPSGTGALYDRIHRECPHLAVMPAPGAVGPTSVIFAWHLKPRNVILAGHDYCYDLIEGKWWENAVSVLTNERYRDIISQMKLEMSFIRNLNGTRVPTRFFYMDAAMQTMGACQLMASKGIRVINATEGGILKPNPRVFRDKTVLEIMSLAAAVAETKI